MKAIMVMFDSLNKKFLQPYGNEWVHTPNFNKLAEKSVVFDSCYAASLPCMPARREIHTGRMNFLHRSWGPIEPFDDSMPEILKQNGIYSHLVSDHYHYWEDGGATYHNRYSSWEIIRGQEGDHWKGEVVPEAVPEHIGKSSRFDWVNRRYFVHQNTLPQAQTFKKGLEFLHTNAHQDNWFCQIETFDPHEPFFTLGGFKALYPQHYSGPLFDWPKYGKVDISEEYVDHIRYQYASLVTMCDYYLGEILNIMDTYNLWEDTMLIVNTDHGFLLGEHDEFAKNVQPFYNEIAQIPLFIWDPRIEKKAERNNHLVQTIDLAPTILDYFNIGATVDMTGKCLRSTMEYNEAIRESTIFGMYSGHINCTDGRYVYMKAPDLDQPIYEYTLMPTHIRSLFDVEELKKAEFSDPFRFTKGTKLMKVPARGGPPDPKTDPPMEEMKDLLFDLEKDPQQIKPIQVTSIEQKMSTYIRNHLEKHDGPPELYRRFQL